MDVLYFGCVERVGHYLYGPDLVSVRHEAIPRGWPFGLHGERIDGHRAPGRRVVNERSRVAREDQVQGHAKVSYLEGWTVLGIWDRTVDERYGSNSNFMARGEYNFEEMTALAAVHFPSIWQRIINAAPVCCCPAEMQP